MDPRVERALQMYQQVTPAVINRQGDYTTIVPLPPGGKNDPLTDDKYQLAGSILKIYKENALREFFAHRASQTVTIQVQLGCPVAYGLGYESMGDQRDLWRGVERECRDIAQEYEVKVVFNMTSDGEVMYLMS